MSFLDIYLEFDINYHLSTKFYDKRSELNFTNINFLNLDSNMLQPTISLEMPIPSQDHCGFPSFPVVDWFCLFVDLWVLPFPLEDCSVFGNFVITLMPTTFACGVYISQLIRYVRPCSLYSDFFTFTKLSNQGFLKTCLILSFKRFFGRYQDLAEKYSVTLHTDNERWYW